MSEPRPPEIAIVDYGVGNIGSIINMLNRVKAESGVARTSKEIRQAQKLILPGMGSFDHAAASLDRSGLRAVLEGRVLKDRIPILGICLGMQILCKKSEEGSLPGLGWIEAEVIRFKIPRNSPLKVPHIGWNDLSVRKPLPILQGITLEDRYYFAHSYHLTGLDQDYVLAETEYGYAFPSVIQSRNIYGIQCHPEKSHQSGMKFLRNFVESG